MAYSRAAAQGTSSDLNSRRRYLYDVFLNFRGEDTRKTFAAHLYTALNNAGFNTFRDDHELERGEDIPPELQRAIQQSRISVVVFSKGYASSAWCLDELVLIAQRQRTTSDHVVLPVFYDVDPSSVRKQRGSFAEAFAGHQKTQPPEKVLGWRVALQEVTSLSGFQAGNYPDDGKLIEDIVGNIRHNLGRKGLSVEPKLVGIQSQVKDIILWLQDGSSNVGIFVMYGMSGIGKTTIAKHVYNSNFRSFEGSSFIGNFKETADQPNGLIQIQKQLLSDILDDGEVKIQSVNEGIIKIEDAISSRRVLLVLDGVEDTDQLDAVLKVKDRFYPGSKILITTTRESLLKANQVTKVHKVEPLDDNESSELFSGHAFGQDHPIEEDMEHSKTVVQHGGRLPSALEVIPNGEIKNELRITVKSSKDNHDREVLREKNANSAEWIFLFISLCMEILSAACDQASSPSKPRYALFSMLLAIAALLTGIWELIYKGMKKNVVWRKRLFGSDIELFVLVGGIAQCVCSIIQYVYYIRHAENPIKMSLLPAIFLMCLIATRLWRTPMQTTYETGEHTAYTE